MSAKTGYEQLLAQLTPKQAMFVREYLVDLNATQAAIRAGYSAKTAAQQAARLLKNVKVKAPIEAGKNFRAEKAELSADYLERQLLRLLSADIGEAFNEDGSLKKIHDIPADVRQALSGVEVVEMAGAAVIGGESGVEHRPMYTKKVKFWDKGRALELGMRRLGLLKDNLNVSGNLSNLSDEELDRRIAEKAGA